MKNIIFAMGSPVHCMDSRKGPIGSSSSTSNAIGVCTAGQLAIDKYVLRRDVMLPPSIVGVDPLNRDEEGISSDHVHNLTSRILQAGFVARHALGAFCVEEAPGETLIRDFTKKLAEDDPLLPQDCSMVKYGSIAKSHVNMGLRCWEAGVACDHEHIKGVKGMFLDALEKAFGIR